MPIYQGNIFQTFGEAGWSNVYYLEADVLTDAGASLDAINTAQLGTQGSSVTTVGLRVSDVSIKGDSYLPNPTIVVGQLAATPSNMAPINLAAHYLFKDAGRLHRVHHYIHGIPLDQTVTDATGHTILTPTYRALAAVATYINTVKSNSVNWQKRSLPPVFAPLTIGDVAIDMSVRKVGRPFDLFRGRRRVA